MSGFLFAFLAILVAAAGARDQVLIATLTRRQGARPMLLAIAMAGALAATAFAGWAAYRLGADMTGPARKALGGIALILAGGEMVLIAPGRKPAEPTRSLFAAFLVLTAWQVSDAARLLVLALGIATAAPVPAALGGAAASCAMLAAGWLTPGPVGSPVLRRARRWAGVGVVLLGGATFIV